MSTTRYPADFSATPATDYLEIKAIRRDYKSSSPKYVTAGIPGSNTLYLNIPQKLGENQTQNWLNSSLGEVGTFLADRTPSGGGNFFVNAVKRLAENALLGKSVEAFQKVGGSNLNENALLSATGGIVYNPNLEVLYNGPDFRSFNYQFAMFTKSEADAKAINDIVRFFQYVSVPSTGGSVDQGAAAGLLADTAQVEAAVGIGSTIGGGVQGAINNLLPGGNGNQPGPIGGAIQGATQQLLNTVVGVGGTFAGALATSAGLLFSGDNRFIKQPPFLLLSYKRGGQDHPFLYSPMPCALTGLSIDYTPTGNYTVMDNFGKQGVATVVGVVITLSLTEIKNVFQSDYEGKMSRSIRAPGLDS